MFNVAWAHSWLVKSQLTARNDQMTYCTQLLIFDYWATLHLHAFLCIVKETQSNMNVTFAQFAIYFNLIDAHLKRMFLCVQMHSLVALVCQLLNEEPKLTMMMMMILCHTYIGLLSPLLVVFTLRDAIVSIIKLRFIKYIRFSSSSSININNYNRANLK